jgi:predicted RNA binding protein YcfA (HicA-like mRNA interferase family)
MPMKVRDAIKLIEDDGWRIVRTRGNHPHFRHPVKLGIVTIAGHPSVDLDPKTQASMLKQAGLRA